MYLLSLVLSCHDQKKKNIIIRDKKSQSKTYVIISKILPHICSLQLKLTEETYVNIGLSMFGPGDRETSCIFVPLN